MNIIIVDDDAFVSASLKIILESYSDITVLATGANGHDAISLYDTYIPDVLLMDIRMEFLRHMNHPKSCQFSGISYRNSKKQAKTE